MLIKKTNKIYIWVLFIPKDLETWMECWWCFQDVCRLCWPQMLTSADPPQGWKCTCSKVNITHHWQMQTGDFVKGSSDSRQCGDDGVLYFKRAPCYAKFTFPTCSNKAFPSYRECVPTPSAGSWLRPLRAPCLCLGRSNKQEVKEFKLEAVSAVLIWTEEKR